MAATPARRNRRGRRSTCSSSCSSRSAAAPSTTRAAGPRPRSWRGIAEVRPGRKAADLGSGDGPRGLRACARRGRSPRLRDQPDPRPGLAPQHPARRPRRPRLHPLGQFLAEGPLRVQPDHDVPGGLRHGTAGSQAQRGSCRRGRGSSPTTGASPGFSPSRRRATSTGTGSRTRPADYFPALKSIVSHHGMVIMFPIAAPEGGEKEDDQDVRDPVRVEALEASPRPRRGSPRPSPAAFAGRPPPRP